MSDEALQFVLGAEHRISDLLVEADIMPLLTQVQKIGLPGARVTDERDNLLWAAGEMTGSDKQSYTLTIEGDAAGVLEVAGDAATAATAANIIGGALNVILHNSLKRRLTTMVHTQVVNQSYEELMETNQRLRCSEKRYRELAETLEVRVRERTEELQQAYARMLQQEKLVSIGQLAAGMAHEINNPLGFVLSNFNTLEKYLGRCRDMLIFCREQLVDQASSEARELFEVRWQTLKMDLVVDDAATLIEQSRSGGERVKEIVSNLKGFSHIDDLNNQLVNINAELDRTLQVMAHEIPRDCAVQKNYGDLPGWAGPPALLCQAFYNLLRNAFQCESSNLVVTLTTRQEGEWLKVQVSDNGPGIPEDVRPRIFEPFFTTREVGDGKGLGLAMVYHFVQSCHGTIQVDSQTGAGTTFELTLPLKGENYGQVR